jgi:hypothetical protein
MVIVVKKVKNRHNLTLVKMKPNPESESETKVDTKTLCDDFSFKTFKTFLSDSKLKNKLNFAEHMFCL